MLSHAVEAAVASLIGGEVTPGAFYGNIDPATHNMLYLTILNIPVKETGGAEGLLVPRIAVREKQGVIIRTEVEIIVLESAKANAAPVITQPVAGTKGLNLSATVHYTGPITTLTTEQKRRSVMYTANPVTLPANGGPLDSVPGGGWVLIVGFDLIAGKTDLDVIVWVERLDTLATVAETRYTDLFSASRVAAFSPVQVGDIRLSITAL